MNIRITLQNFDRSICEGDVAFFHSSIKEFVCATPSF